jgi:hypothetical protein
MNLGNSANPTPQSSPKACSLTPDLQNHTTKNHPKEAPWEPDER